MIRACNKIIPSIQFQSKFHDLKIKVNSLVIGVAHEIQNIKIMDIISNKNDSFIDKSRSLFSGNVTNSSKKVR